MNDEDKTSQNTYTVSIGGNTQSMTYTLDDYSGSSISTIDATSITLDSGLWDSDCNIETVDMDLLEKYPTAKSLYNEFKIVYNMCKANEELEE
tara:strand:+ start:60 stop:338 length:279 start_codon:yes stop_codon:yes gene_type:complete